LPSLEAEWAAGSPAGGGGAAGAGEGGGGGGHGRSGELPSVRADRAEKVHKLPAIHRRPSDTNTTKIREGLRDGFLDLLVDLDLDVDVDFGFGGSRCSPAWLEEPLPSLSRCSFRMVFLHSSSSRVSRCIALFLMAKSTRILLTELSSWASSLDPPPPWLSSESVESDCEMGSLEGPAVTRGERR